MYSFYLALINFTITMNVNIIILICIVFIYLYYNLYRKSKIYTKICIIERSNNVDRKDFSHVIIDQYFIVTDKKIDKMMNISKTFNVVEHNMDVDDILFLIPLYNLIIKTDTVAICDGIYNPSNFDYNTHYSLNHNYSIQNNCIYFNIHYLKILHIHSNILRQCKFKEIYYRLNNKLVEISIKKDICKTDKYSYNYSIVTTLYRRNYINNQIKYFLKQSAPPQNIIVVHDRNYVTFDNIFAELIYIHSINFEAGFYFRYLLSSLSPQENVIIYDDDFIPVEKNSHLKWIYNSNTNYNGINCHRIGIENHLQWCATPLIIKRKLLFLQWINDIFETSQAEDGHLSFSVLLLCNRKCHYSGIYGLKEIIDNQSSPRKKIDINFWGKYVNNTINKINSSYILNLKSLYHIA